VRTPGRQRVQAALGAPVEVAAQIRVGVIPGGTLEPGDMGGYHQPQTVRMRNEIVGSDSG
jgi:hypothetical protein